MQIERIDAEAAAKMATPVAAPRKPQGTGSGSWEDGWGHGLPDEAVMKAVIAEGRRKARARRDATSEVAPELKRLPLGTRIATDVTNRLRALIGRLRPRPWPQDAGAEAATAPAAAKAAARVEGTLTLHPMLPARSLMVHALIADRLEVEAPTCTLHARVALSAILRGAPLDGIVAEMVVADGGGRPRVALLRDQPMDRALEDALKRAGLPVVDVSDDPKAEEVWKRIRGWLPGA